MHKTGHRIDVGVMVYVKRTKYDKPPLDTGLERLYKQFTLGNHKILELKCALCESR